MTQRIMAVLEGPRGAMAAALVTGHRGGIPEQVEEDMRDSGLAHLLSISGLHMGLVAGLLFFALRAGLALLPAVALLADQEVGGGGRGGRRLRLHQPLRRRDPSRA